MARKSHRRMEGALVAVRLAPLELAELDRKAGAAGLDRSALLRAAVAAYQPAARAGAGPARELKVEYDEEAQT